MSAAFMTRGRGGIRPRAYLARLPTKKDFQ